VKFKYGFARFMQKNSAVYFYLFSKGLVLLDFCER